MRWLNVASTPYRSKVTPFRKQFAANLDGLILDCGGGEGAYLPFFNGRVLVMDLSQQTLSHLQHDLKVAADAENLPFRNNSFDNFWACAMVQYLDLDSFIIEAKRVTKPGGRILILVPNFYSPWDLLKKMCGLDTWRDQKGVPSWLGVKDLIPYGKVRGEIQFLPLENHLRRFPRLCHTLMLEIIK